MLTSKPNRIKNHSENTYRIELFTEKVYNNNYELDSFNAQIITLKNNDRLQLPLIYQTENLIKSKQKVYSFNAKIDGKENQKWSMPKIFRSLKSTEQRKAKQSSLQRISTAKKELDGQKIYHNFINKRKNKFKSHMSKIIEKIISQNIQPWDPQNSNIKLKPHLCKRHNQAKLQFNKLVAWNQPAQQNQLQMWSH